VLPGVKATDADEVVAFGKFKVAVAAPIVGVTGSVEGVIELLEPEDALVPAVFVAVTWKVKAVPTGKLLTVIGLAAPVAEYGCAVAPIYAVTV
jgi:hypothetical protein